MEKQIRAYHAGPALEIGEEDLFQSEQQEQCSGNDSDSFIDDCFPLREGIVTIPNSKNTSKRGRPTTVRFSELPSDILHSIGANSYLSAKETLTPCEQELMDGLPGWYGNDPRYHK